MHTVHSLYCILIHVCTCSLLIHLLILQLVQLHQEVQAARQVSVNVLITFCGHSYASMLLYPQLLLIRNANFMNAVKRVGLGSSMYAAPAVKLAFLINTLQKMGVFLALVCCLWKYMWLQQLPESDRAQREVQPSSGQPWCPWWDNVPVRILLIAPTQVTLWSYWVEYRGVLCLYFLLTWTRVFMWDSLPLAIIGYFVTYHYTFALTVTLQYLFPCVMCSCCAHCS